MNDRASGGAYRKVIGRSSEDMAVSLLKSKGYRVIARNFSNRIGEIDIIAKHGDEFVFVEVRSGNRRFLPDPAESVSFSKIKRLRMLALSWLNQNRIEECDLRFDLITVLFSEGYRDVEIRHVEFAF